MKVRGNLYLFTQQLRPGAADATPEFQQMPKRLFLIDAMAQIYRSHFALARSPLYTSKENVTAVYGVTNNLLALIDREKPDLLAAVYDSPQPTFRHHIYEEYKATREKMPEELAEQLPRLDEVLQVLNIPKLILPGYEADDIVGTVAAQAEQEGYEVFLVTGDKDYYQLVTPNVKFYNSNKGLDNVEIYDPAGVQEKFGVPPERVIDVLALAGDSSDNVPGVPGIGPKKAIKFVLEYGSIEEVLNHAEEIGGKTGESLVEFREQAILSKDLVTIRTEAPIAFTVSEMTYGPWDTSDVRELFTELEFRTLFRYLDIDPKSTADEPSKISYKSVTTENALTKLMKQLKRQTVSRSIRRPRGQIQWLRNSWVSRSAANRARPITSRSISSSSRENRRHRQMAVLSMTWTTPPVAS